MKNCLDFAHKKLIQFIMTFGVFQVIDVLTKFQVMTDIVMLDKHYLKTEQVEEAMFGAVVAEMGYYLKAPSELIKRLVTIICNPGSPEEALRINSALKTLCIRNNNVGRFYNLLSEGLHRRMMFYKLSQIYTPLIEEVRVNKDFLIMLFNNDLIQMDHLQEVYDETSIAHYIIHNINDHSRLKKFCFFVQHWVRDTNMIEQLKEITFEIEMFQCANLNQKITEDSKQKLCLLY